MNDTNTFETPHPTVLTREQAYQLPSSRPQTILTPYPSAPLTTSQNLKENRRADLATTRGEKSEFAGQTYHYPSSKTLSTIYSSPRSSERMPLHAIGSMEPAPKSHDAPANRQVEPLVEAAKRIKLKDKMKQRSRPKSGQIGQKIAHISTSTTQFQHFITGRSATKWIENSTLASPFVSRASSPVPGAELTKEDYHTGTQPGPKPLAEKTPLRDKLFDVNRPAQPSHRKRFPQSHTGSPSLPSLKDPLLPQKQFTGGDSKARERYLDYRSPLMSSTRKKGSSIRERRPSAPSRLLTSKSGHKRPPATSKKGKSLPNETASCPSSPNKYFRPRENATAMGPPSFIPSHSGTDLVTRAQTPLSDAHRQPFYESDLDSDLEQPRWLRSSMGVGSVDFNRPPSQMSWFGFSHSGEEVEDWVESGDDDSDMRFRTSKDNQAPSHIFMVDNPDEGIFGQDARGISTPPKRVLSQPALPLTSLEKRTSRRPSFDLSQQRVEDVDGEVDMELSSIVVTGHPTLAESAPLVVLPSDHTSTSRDTSQLISLEDTSISWITDSIVSPPTMYLERALKKGNKKPSETRGSTPAKASTAKDTEPVVEGETTLNDDRVNGKQQALPKLDLKALQASGEEASNTAQSRLMIRTQSLPVTIGGTQSQPISAAATKRTRSGTIVPAEPYGAVSIPAPPHSFSPSSGADKSLLGSMSSVGRTRSGTVVRSSSGQLAAPSPPTEKPGLSGSAVPLSMTRRTRSGTIQAFIQPNPVGARRSRSGTVIDDTVRGMVAPHRNSEEVVEPLFGPDELDMAGIEEEEEMEFAPPDADALVLSTRQARLGRSPGHRSAEGADGGDVEQPSPFIDDAYVPNIISSPDPIDFLSFCTSRMEELVKAELSAGDTVVQGYWSVEGDGEDWMPAGGRPLLWCVAEPPSPEAPLFPRCKREKMSKTPVRRKNDLAKRPVTRRARFQGFEEEINDALQTSNDACIDEDIDFSDDEMDLFRTSHE